MDLSPFWVPVSSVTVAANAPGIEGTHTYTFDALGRRVSKTVNPTGNGAGGGGSSGGGSGSGSGSAGSATTLVFVHSSQQIVAEYTSGQPSTIPLRKYAFGSYIDEPVALIDHTGAGAGGGSSSGGTNGSGTSGGTGFSPSNNGTTTVYHYHANHLYSVSALTDQTGQVVERYAYDAYGQQVILDAAGTTLRSTSLLHNRFTYTGREWDQESHTYHYRARTYDARLARFLQRDPIGYRGGINLSAYVGGRSLGAVDPLGLDWGTPSDYLSPEAYYYGSSDYGRFLNPWGDEGGLPKDEYRQRDRDRMKYLLATSAACAGGAGALAGAGALGISTVGSMTMTEIAASVTGTATALEVATVGGVSEAGAGITIGLITSGGDPTAILDGAIDLATAGAASRFRPRSSPSSGKSLLPDLSKACPCPKNPVPDKLKFPLCDKPDLTDTKGRTHILDGDGPGKGGGHRPGTGKSGKSEFPANWNDDKILGEVSDIATDPSVTWSKPDSRGYITGAKTVDGVDVFVVYDKKKCRIVSGFPTSLPGNP